MNFLAQLGVLAVILIILVIIIKSNKDLEKIYMEKESGEQPEPPEIKMPEFEIPKIKAPKMELSKWSFGKKAVAEGKEEPVAEVPKKVSEKREKPLRSQATVPMEENNKNSLTIEVLDASGRVENVVSVQDFPYTIGRNEDNDLVLDDLSVSGFHARLEEEENWIVLYDQGSLNKLMVSGRQEIKVPISGEVEVGLGNTSLRFVKERNRSDKTLYYAGTSLMEEWH